MHILVTGAAGMIGGKVTERLAKDDALHGRAIEKMRSSAFASRTNSAA